MLLQKWRSPPSDPILLPYTPLYPRTQMANFAYPLSFPRFASSTAASICSKHAILSFKSCTCKRICSPLWYMNATCSPTMMGQLASESEEHLASTANRLWSPRFCSADPDDLAVSWLPSTLPSHSSIVHLRPLSRLRKTLDNEERYSSDFPWNNIRCSKGPPSLIAWPRLWRASAASLNASKRLMNDFSMSDSENGKQSSSEVRQLEDIARTRRTLLNGFDILHEVLERLSLIW